MKKTIALITIAEIIRDAFYEQLKNIFGDRVEIKKFILDETRKQDLAHCELVICSSKVIYEEVREISPAGIEVINVRRAINLKNIFEIFQVEPGKEAIVASNYHYTAMETINLLLELGIDHLNYRPYQPGGDYSGADLAITPGGKFLVPKAIDKIIDIGVKLIDISTIIEILYALQLPLKNTNFLTARYTKKLVEVNKYSSQLNMVLEGMLSTSHDGIIAINEDNQIMFINKMAGELLDIDTKFSRNKNIQDIIEEKTLVELIIDNKNRVNELFTYQDKYIMINKEELAHKNIFKGKIISLKDVTRIQKQEYEIRKKMRKKGFVAKYEFDDIIGVSSKLQRAVNISRKIAGNDLTVLIKGESGTGKELFAQAIHNRSNRSNNPFVAVNFASLSDSLIESELFGYEEGAFTGAKKGGKAGLFEQAHTGTIFIDEIGDASLRLQARLLRVLQEKEVMRVGGNSIIPVDVRVIAATNKDLEQLVKKGEFRRDLYYRLKVLYFTVPPLRERVEDIYYLVNYFLQQKNSNRDISDEVFQIFREHDWPGNVRELENIVNYIINIVEDRQVRPEHLPDEFRKIAGSRGQSLSNKYSESETIPEEIGPVGQFELILKTLEEARQKGLNLGRNRIARFLNNNHNIDITPDMVRNRLKKLENKGLVTIGKTRQGTQITRKGREFLNNIGS